MILKSAPANLFQSIINHIITEHNNLERERGGEGTLNYTEQEKKLIMQMELQIANCEESEKKLQNRQLQIELLEKQNQALLDRFNVAAKALERIQRGSATLRGATQIAKDACDEINKMIVDYDKEIPESYSIRQDVVKRASSFDIGCAVDQSDAYALATLIIYDDHSVEIINLGEAPTIRKWKTMMNSQQIKVSSV